MKLRISKAIVSAVAATFLATTSVAQGPELRRADLSAPITHRIIHIAGGMYQAMANTHSTAFMVTDEGIILADPLSTEFSEWLKGEFEARFGVPVRYVVYSHYHWDHGSGGEVFADTARFVAHENLPSYLELPSDLTTLDDVVGQYEPVAALDADGNGYVDLDEIPIDFQRFPGSTQHQFTGFDENGDGRISGAEAVRGPISHVYPPDITYSDEITIELGGKRVTLTWVGDMNHSSDTSLISFPDENTLLIVDYISARLPNREMDYELGKFSEWMDAIYLTEEIAQDYQYVVTGHGPYGDWTIVRNWREYFEKLRDAVAAGIAAEQTLKEMQATITMDEYSDWEGFDWVAENVLGMYHFLTD